MTTSSKGISKGNAVLKKMPSGIGYIQFGKTTGLRSDYTFPTSYSNVMSVLDGLTFTAEDHVPNVYDCEDRAFWGVAQVRCKYPGQPIGVALGVAKELFEGENHAVIVLWPEESDPTKEFKFYDPEVKLGGARVSKFVNFDAKVIVPFPVFTPHQPGAAQGKFAPFNKFDYATGALVLDRDYKLIDDNKFTELKKYFANKEYGECPRPKDNPGAYDKYWTESIEDRVLWAWVHARRKYKGLAIGMAFGTAEKSYDHAVIVLWREPNGNPVFIDIGEPGSGGSKGGEVGSDKFVARTVIA